MRYFIYTETDDRDAVISEEDIRREYYPYWTSKMNKKFGKEYVDNHYTFDDCVVDFMVIHWATEIENG